MKKVLWITGVILFLLIVVVFFLGNPTGNSSKIIKNMGCVFCAEGAKCETYNIGSETSSILCKEYCEEKFKSSNGFIEEGNCYCGVCVPK